MGWNHRFYRTSRGDSPVEEYIAHLDDDDFDAVRRDIDLMDEFGPLVRVVDTKHIEGKLWELRVRTKLAHRFFYVAVSGQTIVYLHAISKKTPETPKNAKALARRRMAEVL